MEIEHFHTKANTLSKTFKNFWKEWQKEKHKYPSINQWWESGKLYFKIIAIKFSTQKKQKLKNKLQKLKNNILDEKTIQNQI